MNEQMNMVNSPLSEELLNDKTSYTRSWQQNQYLVDSGINSALETHTHSVSSRHGYDEMDSEDQNKKDWKCLSNININENFTNDICMLTPESPGSNICGRQGGEAMADVNLSSAYDIGKTECDLEFGLDIDKLEAESAIPDLVKLIKDEDDAVVINEATMMVFQLSKSDAIDALINSKEMISCIIEAMNKAEHAEAVRFLAGAIYNMSQKKYGLKVIFEANVIPCLVKLLGFSMESVLFYAITTLHNLLLYQEDGKEAVRLSGCIPKLVSLLQKNNIKFLTICTDCLQILAFNHQPSKIEILKNGGPLHLIHIIKNYDYEKLLWTATRVLKVLSVCSANKPVIIREGGIEALTNILYHTIQRNSSMISSPPEQATENPESHPQFSQRLLHNCLWTLRNLSDAATRINFDHLLKVLVQILISSYNSFQRQNVHIDTNAVICAAGILSNLTCNNQYNKIALFKLGGVEALVRVIEWNFTSLTNSSPQNKLNSANNSFSEDILEPCICALRHLTSRHEEAETVQTSLIQLQGLSLLIRLLEMQLGPDLFHMQTHQPVMPNLFLSYYKINWTLIKAIIGLIRNMAMSSCNFVAIRERGFVWPMIVLINRAQIEIANKSACSPISSKDKLLDEIMEVVCGALHMLAKDPGIRAQIISIKLWQRLLHCPQQIGVQSAVNVVAGLLFNNLESIQRVAVGLLVELSAERVALEMIMTQMVITNKLNEMVHSKSEAVSTYASAILIRATEEKNKRYTPCHGGYGVPMGGAPVSRGPLPPMGMPSGAPNASPGFLNSILNSPVMHGQPPCLGGHRHMQTQGAADQTYINAGDLIGGDLLSGECPSDMQVGYGPPSCRYHPGNQGGYLEGEGPPMRAYLHDLQRPPAPPSSSGKGRAAPVAKEPMEMCLPDSDWLEPPPGAARLHKP